MNRGKFFGTAEGSRYWCNLDVEGVGTSLFTEILYWSTYLFSQTIFIPYVFQETTVATILRVLTSVLFLLCIICHLRCMFTNPGAVPHNARPLMSLVEDDGNTILHCGICDAYKPKKAHHCSVCQRCILKMDHHCPWVNNCIGMMNSKYFVLLLFYSFFYTLIMLICCISVCIHGFPNTTDSHMVITIVSTLVSLFFAVFFCIFSLVLFFQFWETLTTGRTLIDRRKKEESYGNTKMDHLKEVFGDSSSILSWFVPTKPNFGRFAELAEYE